MSSMLKNRILRIDNEVKQLHPLLESIFKKMSSINKVEYTHGPNEKGADFILTKISEELGDSEHIGVIVKIGKIVQNLSNISEQIEECTLKRHSSNGKKEVYLSEIWVVCNNTISTNAKEKIFEKYRSQKIKFIDINTLSDLCEKYIPEYGIDIDIQSSELLNKQKEYSIEREQKYNLLSLKEDSTLIKQEIIHQSNGFEKDKKIENIFEEIEENCFLYIESQMGGGKSHLLNRIVKHYSNLETYKEKKIIPIYINSRDFFNEENDISEKIKKIESDYKLPYDKDRKFLLLIDGIDEIKHDNEEFSEKLLKKIHETKTNENIKLIISSRDISNDIIESDPFFRKSRYHIKPLNLTGMIKFLESVCDGLSLKTRFIEDLKQSDLFRVLPKTPIAAIILAKLISEGSEELPMNLTELYSKYCELSLGRWDVDKGLKTQKQFEALDVIVGRIAEYMLDNEIQILSKGEAKEIFRNYLSERNLKLDSDELFEEMLERSGILVEDNTIGTISFKHRSFSEFFYAKRMLSKQEITIDKNIFNPYWTNTYFFYIGLKRDYPELLERIIDINTDEEGLMFSKMINLGNLLLAGYQSPYWVIEKGVDNAFHALGKYYNDIFDRKNDSPLGIIPPIHLLGLFNGIINHNYNYKFLEKAIKNSIQLMIKGETSQNPYTMFLLDSVSYRLNKENLFENTLSHYNGTLPTVIELAIDHESKALQYESKTLKKVQKRLIKNRKRSKEFNSGVISLYKESINGLITLSDGMKHLNKISKKEK